MSAPMHTPGLTEAEKIFALRMVPHIQAGLSTADAAGAVIEDDARLFAALLKRRTAHFFPTPDERGRSVSTPEMMGDLIASGLARFVYAKAKGAAV